MKKISLFLTNLVFLFAYQAAQPAMADTMRCDRTLVTRGDSQGEVLAACGEPMFASQRKIYRSGIPSRRLMNFSPNRLYHNLTSRELVHHDRSVVEVPVDVWTYNFGPRQFMREITFMDGRVLGIETLGYGHR